jgi:hypothetical protein
MFLDQLRSDRSVFHWFGRVHCGFKVHRSLFPSFSLNAVRGPRIAGLGSLPRGCLSE